MVYACLQDGGFERLFRQVKKAATASASNAISVLLVAAAQDVDAICAAKILAGLLAAEQVPFRLVPVRGMEDVLRLNEQALQGSDAIKHIFFINCLAGVDVSAVLSLGPQTKAFLIDCHRPVHLANLFDNGQVIFLDDGGVEENKQQLETLFHCARLCEEEAAAAASEEEETEEEAVSEEEAAASGEEKEAKEEARPQEEKETKGPFARRRARPSRQARLLDAQAALKAYYGQAAGCATAASCLLYGLCSAVGKEGNQPLWNAICGTTANFLACKSGRLPYEASIAALADEVARFNRHAAASRQQPAADNAGVYADDFADGRLAFSGSELSLFLLRHWNLYDSLCHSRCTAAKLGVWRESGLHRLGILLAKLALPLRDCHQDFCLLAFCHKQGLEARFAGVAEEFGLQDVAFPTFVKTFSYAFQASAPDVVHSLVGSLQAGGRAAAGGDGDGEAAWQTAFFAAFSSLDSGSSGLASLKKGIAAAIAGQRLLHRQAAAVLSRHLVKLFKGFRFILLREAGSGGPLPGAAHGLDALACRSLGHFVLAAFREGGKAYLPLLVAAETHGRAFSLQLVTDGSDDGALQGRFTETCAGLAAHCTMTGFAGSQASVSADWLMQFVARLASVN